MNKKLRIKDKLIFTALFLTDRFAEMIDYAENPRQIEPYKLRSDQAYQYLAKIYKQRSLENAAQRITSKEIKFDPKKISILLDAKTFKETYHWKKFRLITQSKKWDGLWRVVVFDIPEKQRKARDSIRHHLKKLGFVFWQKSVWVTIFDIKKELGKLLKDVGLEKYVIVLEAKNIGSFNNQKLIKTFFSPEKINNNYQRFIFSSQQAIKNKKNNQIKLAHEQFFKAICEDSGVPNELLVDSKLRKKAVSLFKKMAQISVG